MEHLLNDPTTTANWEQLRPVIDETLDELSTSDREVVLLRFFANLPHAKIGLKLNLSENTARMRVDRALEKLRASLAKRGVTSTAVALSTVLANQALASAPAGLAASTTSAVLAGVATTTVTTAAAAKIISFMSTTKLILGTAGVVSIAATVLTWHERQTNAELRGEITSLRQQTTSLQTENEQLAADKKHADELARTEHGELLQLRTANHALHNQSAEPATTEQTGATSKVDGQASSVPALTDKISVDTAAKKAGRETPQNAARTLLWYLQGGDIKHAAELLAFEPAEKDKLKDFIDTLPANIQDQYGTPAKLIAFAMAGSPKPLANVQLLSETQVDDYTATQHVRLEYKNGEVREDDLQFHRDVDGWKQVVSPASVDRVITYLKMKR
jgi:cell division protein FtsL